MARLWSNTAGLQSLTAGVEYTSFLTTAPAIETSVGVGANGTGYRINNITAAEMLRQTYTSTQGDFYFRFYLYIVAMPTVATVAIGGFRTTGAEMVSIRLTTAGVIQLYNSEDSAQVGSDGPTLSLVTRYRIEVKCDATTLASTSVAARVDGTEFASGTINLAANPVMVSCGIIAGNATLDYVVSDLAVNSTAGSFQNTWPGAGSLVYLRPNGNGDNSDWGGSDGNSTDNYLLIDETPVDTADYVEENTSGLIDDYTLTNTPAAVGASDTINVVHVGVYAAVNDATSGDPDMVLRIKAVTGGTVEESASLDCNSVTYQGPAPLPANSNYQLTLYDLPGASTTAWTKADLDAAQAGVREAVTDTHFARVAALWVIADFTAAVAGAALSRPPLIVKQAVNRASTY